MCWRCNNCGYTPPYLPPGYYPCPKCDAGRDPDLDRVVELEQVAKDLDADAEVTITLKASTLQLMCSHTLYPD